MAAAPSVMMVARNAYVSARALSRLLIYPNCVLFPWRYSNEQDSPIGDDQETKAAKAKGLTYSSCGSSVYEHWTRFIWHHWKKMPAKLHSDLFVEQVISLAFDLPFWGCNTLILHLKQIFHFCFFRESIHSSTTNPL